MGRALALKDRRIPSNPARGVNLPRKVKGKHKYLSHEQVNLLAENVKKHSDGTGCRTARFSNRSQNIVRRCLHEMRNAPDPSVCKGSKGLRDGGTGGI